MIVRGVTALYAVTGWVVSLARERRFNFPQRVDILRKFLGSRAYGAVRYEVFSGAPNVARAYRALCGLQVLFHQLAQDYSMVVLPEQVIRA